MTHTTTNVAMVKGRTERLCKGNCRIHDTKDMRKNNFLISFPFLKSKVLNINMTSTWCRATGIDHEYSRGVVLEKGCRAELRVSEFEKDGSQVLGNLGGMDGSKEFGLGRASGDG